MKKIFGIFGTAAVVSLLSLSACSLDHAQRATYVNFNVAKLFANQRASRLKVFPDTRLVGRYDDLSRLLSGPDGSMSSSTPSSIAGFSCFAVNVVGPDIPAYGGANVSFEGDPECTYPGLTSTLYPASASGGQFELAIPTGPSRTLQVLGIQSSAGCPSGSLADQLQNVAFTGIYELGRTTSDIYVSSEITVKNAFLPASLKSPFSCRAYKHFAYVLNAHQAIGTYGQVNGTIDVYSVDLATGALSPVQQDVLAGPDAVWITVDPAGRFVYVANLNNVGAGSISQFQIEPSTGMLSPLATPITGSVGLNTLAIDPYSQYLYTGNANGASSSMSAYSIGPDGTLGHIGDYTSGVGNTPSAVFVEQTGNYVYSVNNGSNDISAQLISSTTPVGSLSPVSTTPYSIAQAGTTPGPVGMAIDPTGTIMFVGNTGGSQGISMFTIADDGSLTENGPPADAGSQYGTLAVDPYTGGFVYGGYGAVGATGGGVSTFTIDPYTGAFAYAGYSYAPAPNITMQQVTVDPLGYYVYAIWDEGYIATYPILGDGYATSEGMHYVKQAVNLHPISIVTARVPQP